MKSKELEALEKINHTICLNSNNKTLKFGLDDLDHIDCKDVDEFVECYNTIKSALEALEDYKQIEKELGIDLITLYKALKNEKQIFIKEKLEYAIKDLFANHIEFVAEKDKCYFKIRNSKGKEKSFTSKTFEDFWKEAFGLDQ